MVVSFSFQANQILTLFTEKEAIDLLVSFPFLQIWKFDGDADIEFCHFSTAR